VPLTGQAVAESAQAVRSRRVAPPSVVALQEDSELADSGSARPALAQSELEVRSELAQAERVHSEPAEPGLPAPESWL